MADLVRNDPGQDGLHIPVAVAGEICDAGREDVSAPGDPRRLTEHVRRDAVHGDLPFDHLTREQKDLEVPRAVDPKQPAAFLPALRHDKVSGVLEFISNGRVNYLLLEDGGLTAGYLCAKPATQNVDQYIASMFEPGPNGAAPALAAMLFPPASELPAQAPQALIQTYRELYWRLLDALEREFPTESRRRAQRASAALKNPNQLLTLFGVPRGQDIPDTVVRPDELPDALAAFATNLLETAELVMPGAAAGILREATREHRYVLQAAGFYDRLPWRVTW